MKRPTFAIILTAALLGACSPSASDLKGQAQQAMADVDYPAALDLLSQALAEKPSDPELLEMMARVRLQLGDAESALGAIKRLESLGRLTESAQVLAAEAELQRGNADAATAHVEGLDSAQAWHVRALAAMQAGDPARAGEAFSAGASAPGAKARLFADHAHYLIEQGDVPKARRAADKALAENAELLESRFANAAVLRAEGRIGDALTIFQGVLDEFPTQRGALLGAIGILGDQGRIDELEGLVQRGFNAMPGDPEFIYLSARVAAERQDWATVHELLQGGEAALRNNPDAQGLYAQAMLELGQAEQAHARLAPLFRAHSDYDAIRRLYARSLEAVGESEEARRVLAGANESLGPA